MQFIEAPRKRRELRRSVKDDAQVGTRCVLAVSSPSKFPCEEHFRPVLPTGEGNVDYLSLRGQLTTMDELLRTSGVENEFIVRSLEHWIKTLSESQVEQIELSGEGQRE